MNIRNYIVVLFISAFIFGCSNPQDNWKECDKNIHPDFKVGDLFTVRMGNVTMQNGESCYLEEVQKVYRNCHDYNEHHYLYDGNYQCKYCKIWTTPVARRLVCPSGISTNSVTYDGSKFHRELIH